DAVDDGDADDHQLAQSAGQARLPAHGVHVLEPGLGERRAVQQQAVDVDEISAALAADASDQPVKLGVVLLLDQRDPRHRRASGLRQQVVLVGHGSLPAFLSPDIDPPDEPSQAPPLAVYPPGELLRRPAGDLDADVREPRPYVVALDRLADDLVHALD